jgi:peptidoglycan hydrolase-like protein with peptidoglycan-binding domain
METSSVKAADLTRYGGNREVPAYPGGIISPGSRGDSVKQIQRCLNNISVRYPEIGRIAEDGVFGEGTRYAVEAFQRIFGLARDGIVGPATWLAINEECAAAADGGQQPPENPGGPLSVGMSGARVLQLQRCLNSIGREWPGAAIPRLAEDGAFGAGTESAVTAFQRFFLLSADGVAGPVTLERIMNECQASGGASSAPPEAPEAPPEKPSLPQYPGYLISSGSSGSYVLRLQQCLNRIRTAYPAIPALTDDGVFGGGTKNAVMAFQTVFNLKPDGIVGQQTWTRIMEECLNTLSGSAPREAVIQGTGAESRVVPRNDALLGMMCMFMMSCRDTFGKEPSEPQPNGEG